MCYIKALSKDTILTECEHRKIELSTDDRIRLKQDFCEYNKDEILSVKPDIDNDGNYELHLWNRNRTKGILDQEDEIIRLVCETSIEKI